jgi:Sec-independent protein secretion pathway component TatC
MDNNTKRSVLETLMWIGIYFGIAFIVSIFLAFPYSLIVIVGAIIGLGLYRRRRQLRKAGQASSGGSSHFGNMFGSQRGINYYCMNCGTKHNEVSCPNCGSKLKKAGF